MHLANDDHTPDAIDFFLIFEGEERAAEAEAKARAFLTKWRSVLRGEEIGDGPCAAMRHDAKQLSDSELRWICRHGVSVIGGR